MSHRRRALILPAATIALTLGASADAAASQTITANGTGTAKVTVTDRRHNAAILEGVTAAHTAAIPKAIADAREEAQRLATATGLTLGALQSVAEAPASPIFYGPFGSSYENGPFGPGKFCGTIHRAIFRTVHGKRKLVRTVKQRRCIVPSDETVELSITFAAS
jgi:Protein of unknown function (DUF541)